MTGKVVCRRVFVRTFSRKKVSESFIHLDIITTHVTDVTSPKMNGCHPKRNQNSKEK